MKRRQRTHVLIEGDRALLARMAQQIQQAYHVDAVKDPVEELVMLKVRETARRSQFYLGEALMTSCMVCINEVYGYGMVMGEDHDKAFELAVVDAAYTMDEAWCADQGFSELLTQEADRLAAEKRQRNKALLRTQVDFSTMDTEL